ncbi:hypothetical protein Ccrd_010162 [Cynara cardunculus var. scolymus]|uniref:Importin N-terminal domain-containing protein n=1 Tax=Cynara cardunculus var. scolymus TaxID=59895 RepID=A0A103YLS0_CYNCS|nr:hypothetical protein Ccrd_010162 [Cynara cardunculus var. scolymus]
MVSGKEKKKYKDIIISINFVKSAGMALSVSDLPAMYTLLSNSLSGDEALRKPAESTLAQSENLPGFSSCLMEVITAKDLVSQTDVRLMASLYFKNSINRYWRNKRDSQGITNEEKSHLRQKLLSHLREENYQIALTLAVLISKIARIDYPKEWPELFSVLAQQLQSADVISSHRIFMILFRTLKELSTKRLTSDQRNFAEISSQFFDYSWHLWQSDMQTILNGFSSLAQITTSNASEHHHDELYLICERWFLCSKIIRQLIVSGFPSDEKSLQLVALPTTSVINYLVGGPASQGDSSFAEHHRKFFEFIRKACTKVMKILVAIQMRHPYSFGDQCVLPLVMDFCLNKITDPEPEIMSFDQFLIQCMSMAKIVLECKEYKPIMTGRVIDENVVTLEQRKKNISGAVAGVLTSLLPNDRVVLLCNVLIRRYFVLTASDLEEWHQNPESFHHEQDAVLWSEKLRPCAEALYIVLFHNHSQLLGPVVVSILQEAMNGCPPSVTDITSGLLLKDAAYGAAAYIYYELSNYLSFKDWFNNALSLELTNDHPNMRIIHRKVALILGQWVSEIKDDTKRPVYCALIRLLQDRDLCVRVWCSLYSSQYLTFCSFSIFYHKKIPLCSLISLIFQLAASRSLYFHIEDAAFSQQEFSDLLPVCWKLSFKLVEDVQEFDSKVQVLNTISVLIAYVGDIIPYANELVQFFQKSWEESSGESLLQIQLLTALRNFVVALGYKSPMCYSVLLPILVSGLDVAASIIEGYIILGGPEFLSMHASSVAKLFDLVVGNVNDRGLLSILPVIDVLIQCSPSDGPQLISSALQKMIVICLTGDDRVPTSTAVKASAAATLARILVTNTNFLAQLASEPSLVQLLQNAGFPVGENILLCLVDIWLDKVDNVNYIQKKTFGFALSIILTLRLPQVLDKLDQILSVCTSVILGGSEDTTEDESSSDSMSSSRPQFPSKEYRRRQIKISDPINQLSLEKLVRENLQTCASLHGEAFNTAMGRMHPAALAQLKQALKMT